MKKLLLGLIVSLLSASAIMAQSFQYNNEETVRNALALYEYDESLFFGSKRASSSRTYSSNTDEIVLSNLCIPLYMSFPQNGTVKFCWYDTKMMFGEKVRTSESPSRTEEGTYVNGRLSMYKASDGYIYKFNWVNIRGMVLLESIVKYRSDGSEDKRYSSKIYGYTWADTKTFSKRIGNHHTRSISMYNSLITREFCPGSGEVLFLFGLDFHHGALHTNYVRGEYCKGDWKVEKGTSFTFSITPDGRFGKSELLYDFNDHVRCENYVY